MKNNEKTIRTFLALDLHEKIRKDIHNLYNSLQNKFKIKVRWVAFENLHLTIKFLGNIQEKRLDKIIKKLENLDLRLNINLILDSYGVFPPKGIPRVLWVSFKEKEEDYQLSSLFKTIEHELKTLGFPKEKRKFTPHITIARLKLKNKTESEKFNKLLEIFKSNFDKTEKEFFTINKLTLFKSELKPSGAVYCKIKEF